MPEGHPPLETRHGMGGRTYSQAVGEENISKELGILALPSPPTKKKTLTSENFGNLLGGG